MGDKSFLGIFPVEPAITIAGDDHFKQTLGAVPVADVVLPSGRVAELILHRKDDLRLFLYGNGFVPFNSDDIPCVDVEHIYDRLDRRPSFVPHSDGMDIMLRGKDKRPPTGCVGRNRAMVATIEASEKYFWGVDVETLACGREYIQGEPQNIGSIIADLQHRLDQGMAYQPNCGNFLTPLLVWLVAYLQFTNDMQKVFQFVKFLQGRIDKDAFKILYDQYNTVFIGQEVFHYRVVETMDDLFRDYGTQRVRL